MVSHVSVDLPSSRSARRLTIRKKCLYSAIVCIAFFGGLEIAVRLLWSPPSSQTRDVGTRRFITWLSKLSLDDREPLELYEPDGSRLWRLRAGKSFRGINYHHAPQGEQQSIEITINARGYRGPLISETADSNQVHRALCLGDSNFFGYPLDDRHTFPAALERQLNGSVAKEKWSVINAGIPGYSSMQGRRWYDDEFAENHFDWLLISYVNNDAWLQPHSDRSLVESHEIASLSNPAAQWILKAQFPRLLQSWLRSSSTENARSPRVPLDEFQANYSYLIQQARDRRCRVLILDYCVYANYAAYSKILKELAHPDRSVLYFHVGEAAVEAIRSGEYRSVPDSCQDAVKKRWGERLLADNPMLWLYAEFYPEHLNEVGTTWLSSVVAPMLSAGAEDRDH